MSNDSTLPAWQQPIHFGSECEQESGATELLAVAYDMGLVSEPHLHEYHCRCQFCRHDFDRANPWTAQDDCSISGSGGGEFISKPLLFGGDEHFASVEGLATAMLRARSNPGLRAGNHVHVEAALLGPGDSIQRHRLARLFHRYQDNTLALLARGREDAVRSYNGHNRPYSESAFWSTPSTLEDYQSYTNHYAYEGNNIRLSSRLVTVEFRLWNSTRTEWRLNMHAGLSVAMVRTALDPSVWVEQHDSREFLDIIAPYCDDATLESAHRQLAFASR